MNRFDEWLRILELKIKNSDCEIFFFDNLTTTWFYEPQKPDKQSEVFSKLREILKDCNIPGFFIAHMSSQVKDQNALLRANDIFGSKSPARKSEFVYIYQLFIAKSSGSGDTAPITDPIIRVPKARGFDAHGIYLLNYNHGKKEYYNDIKIPNEKMKDIVSNAFKLAK